MVFLILTFYLIFFAGFADIVDYLPIRYRKAEALSGIKDICRRYRNGKYRQNRRIGGIGNSPTFTFTYLLSICFMCPETSPRVKGFTDDDGRCGGRCSGCGWGKRCVGKTAKTLGMIGSQGKSDGGKGGIREATGAGSPDCQIEDC